MVRHAEESWGTLTVKYLLIIYFISGITGLAYEILWSRLISMQFGLSVFGVISVVTSFMAGLGLGALLALRKQSLFEKSPFLFLAVLELFIAIYALLLLPFLNLIWSNSSHNFADLHVLIWLAVQLVIVIMVLTLPAILMGMGFTIMINALKQHTVAGKIYAINTLGAVIGALIPLWLLPSFGWVTAHYIIIVINLLLALAFYLFHYKHHMSTNVAVEDELVSNNSPVYYLYALIGALAIMVELIWIRLFGLVLLRTEYIMAIIVAIFLVGIGLGSYLFSRIRRYQSYLTYLPFVVSGLLILGMYFIPNVSQLNEVTHYDSFAAAIFFKGLIICLLTLPVTLLFGAWYPLLVQSFQQSSQSAVKLYAYNSLGAAIGCVVLGLFFLPLLGSVLSLVVIALLVSVVGIYWQKNLKALFAIPVLLLFAWPVMTLPPVSELLPNHYAKAKDLFMYEDMLAINHVVQDHQGERVLLSDLRRVDASSEYTAVETQKNQARLGLLLHKDPKTVLFLGLGTGITAAGSLAYSVDRTAIELSAGAIRASEKWFNAVNSSVNQKMQILQDDIRRYLIRNNKRYDVIIGDLFHPDLLGRGALLTVQQFARCKAHLSSGGLYIQWLALNQFDSDSLKTVMASFAAVFSYNAMFIDGTRLALVGFEQANWSKGLLEKFHNIDESLATGGEGAFTWLSRNLGSIQIKDYPLQSEWYPVIEYQLPGAKYSQRIHLLDNLKFLFESPIEVESLLEMYALQQDQVSKFSKAVESTQLLAQSLILGLQHENQAAQKYARLAYGANKDDRWASFRWADFLFANLQQTHLLGLTQEQLLKAVLSVRPEHQRAIKAMLQLHRERGQQQQAQELWQRLTILAPYQDLSSLSP